MKKAEMTGNRIFCRVINDCIVRALRDACRRAASSCNGARVWRYDARFGVISLDRLFSRPIIMLKWQQQ